jgi:hypothetical protein
MAKPTLELMSKACKSRHSFDWDTTSNLFYRFSEDKWKELAGTTSFSKETLQRLQDVIITPLVHELNEEDAALLNWLDLKDFRSAYKLYRVAV